MDPFTIAGVAAFLTWAYKRGKGGASTAAAATAAPGSSTGKAKGCGACAGRSAPVSGSSTPGGAPQPIGGTVVFTGGV